MQARALQEVQEAVAAMLGSSIPDDQVHTSIHLFFTATVELLSS
jgi:hypothetical protein